MEMLDPLKRQAAVRNEELTKLIVKSSPAFIITSARESLKQFQLNKAQSPNLPRQPKKNTSISKLNSPPSFEKKDNFDNLFATRAHSAIDNTATYDNSIFPDNLDSLMICRRVTIEKNRRPLHKFDKTQLKPLDNSTKNNSRPFIIKHKKGNSNEIQKSPFLKAKSLDAADEQPEIQLDEDDKPSQPNLNLLHDTITEERKSEISSYTSNKTLPKEEIVSVEISDKSIKKEDLSLEKPIEDSYDFSVNSWMENRSSLKDRSNTILKKDEQIAFDVRLGEILGEGAYGRVYKALNIDTGNFLAVKEIKLKELQQKPSLDISSLCQEIEVYQKLEHENIARYLGAKQENGDVYIYIEYMPGGSISSMLKQYGSFEEKVIRKFTRQVALGLDYLHNKGVVHRDIKGGNILSDGDGNAKLADFGASKLIDYLPFVVSISNSEVCNSIKGSLYWMAPELLNQKKYGRKIDIWSLGCTVIEMATAYHPWPNVRDYTELVLAMLIHKCPPIPDVLSEDGKDFVRQCCQFDKRLRPKTQELLNHPFLKDL